MGVAEWREPLGRSIGRVAREVRVGFGWSQRDLAARVGHSQSKIARLEAGAVAHLDLQLADAVLEELGIQPHFDTRVPGLSDRRRQSDRVHARCCGYVGRHLLNLGWEVRHEVEVGTGRRRGWIDLLAYRAEDGAIFSPEVKSELHDAGAIQRTIAWYERASWEAARRLGWRPRRATAALLLLCSEENDQRVVDNRELLRQTFPARAGAIDPWLRDPRAPLPARSLAMIDPRSRRHDWLRPTRSDGRRAPAPYRDYADAARRLG
jgi:transcriptional regulator with XRE-family HTH domain